jgi:4-amino-4-deoxy-L-arabinose transferase-like glycosyltransferase
VGAPTGEARVTARRFGWALGAIVLAGLVLRALYAYALVKANPLLGDGLEFHLQANLLADGHGYIQPFVWQRHHVAVASADKPPLYPLLEAALSLAGGRSYAWHHLVAIASGTATIAVVGPLGRRLAGPRAGLIAAALAAIYPLLIAADGSLRSESTEALFVALTLLVAVRLRERPSVRDAILVGALVALAALTRGEALLLLPLVALPAAGWRTRYAGLAAIACLVVLSPWLARTWIALDQPVAISTNTGGLIAGANCATTYHGALLGQWDYRCIPLAKHRNEAQEADRLRGIGLRYARDHAGRLPVVVAARLGRSFELLDPRRQAREEKFFEGRNLRVEEAGIAMYYVLVVLAAYGVVLLRRRGGPWLLMLAPFAIVAFVSVTAYGFTRLRVTAEPALVVLAAVAIDGLVARWRSA